jgi:hypothetical protein
MQTLHRKKRAKAMLPEIKLLITSTALNQPEVGRMDLADELITEIEKDYPTVVPPAWETVVKIISEARNQSSDEDKPWSMETLNVQEAANVLLDDHVLVKRRISSKTIAQIFILKAMGLQAFSVRDAKWLDRLSALPLPLEILRDQAQQLSLLEKLQEISDNKRIKNISRIKFDTKAWENNLVKLLRDPEWQWQVYKMAKNEPEGKDVVALTSEIRDELKKRNKEEKIEKDRKAE